MPGKGKIKEAVKKIKQNKFKRQFARGEKKGTNVYMGRGLGMTTKQEAKKIRKLTEKADKMKPKKSKLVDDMGNKGRGGKGPKPMNKAGRESAKQERKNLLTENPVVNRSFSVAANKADMVRRFQGSTKKLGNTTAMKAMLTNALKKGLAADLGKKLGAPSSEKFTPSKRDMELKDAHLGTPPQQSADPAKLTYKKAGGPVKPEDKKAKR